MTHEGGAIYADRADAGRVLARLLSNIRATPGALLLALPRGGVPVGFEISQRLNLPLDVLIVRKLGVPGREELAMGAIASGDLVVLNQPVIRALHLSARRHSVESSNASGLRSRAANSSFEAAARLPMFVVEW